MLSDALFDGAKQIEYYLTAPPFVKGYSAEIKEKAWAIIKEMDRLRLQGGVDVPLDVSPITDAKLEEIQQSRRKLARSCCIT